MPEEKFIPPYPLKTAVLFLIYKRPDTTKLIFEAIRQAKPPRLYVAADGPKLDVPGEEENVERVRNIILNGVDWDCEVKTLFQDTNLGCKYGVSGGIDWFFENEEEGIILEDDTLPSQSFFWFCDDLLEKYRNDERIGMISGNNFFYQIGDKIESYHFSRIGSIWGWASWKRVWEKYDVELHDWGTSCENCLRNRMYNEKMFKVWKKRANQLKNNQIDTWDFQFALIRFINSYLTIRPNINLVGNIGLGDIRATHTKKSDKNELIKRSYYELNFPIKYAECVVEDKKADYSILKKNINKSLPRKIIQRFLN